MLILLVRPSSGRQDRSIRAARSTHPSPFLTAAQQMLCGGLLLLLAGIVTGELRDFHPRSISMLSLGSFIYLIIIGAVVG